MQRYVFFLHNRFVEEVDIKSPHPEYGLCEYDAIVSTFQKNGFSVITEKRPRNADVNFYARKTVKQIDSLLKNGVNPSEITVVGTSKGSFIAMTVSSLLKNKDVNFVFIGCCWSGIATEMPDLRFYGKILSIYEASDSLGQTCSSLKNKSDGIKKYKELALNTGMKHGYLYKAMDAWMQPAMAWAMGRELVPNDLTREIDSLIEQKTTKPFNGIIIISQNGATKYGKCIGYSDLAQKTPLQLNDRFIIGSISKQVTAALVLKEYEQGRLKLHVPIRIYLPELEQKWADTITIHQLLTHTHGIKEPEMYSDEAVNALGKTLLFRPGTQFSYSQIGYKLLADIVSKTSGKSFDTLAEELFQKCNMPYTHHPLHNEPGALVQRYIRPDSGSMQGETNSIPTAFVPAGGFISSVFDMITWNKNLYGKMLIADSTYALMATQHKNAVRQHPLFGKTSYGYGITVTDNDGILQLGQTGYIPGSASMNYYFPNEDISVVILNNVVWTEDIKTSFYYHKQILDIVRESVTKIK